LYDHLLTLGPEIELFWSAPWSLGKFLFFATKYFAFADGPLLIYSHVAPASTSPFICTLLYKISGVLIIWGIFLAELILVFRTWAFWNRDRRLAIGLLAFLTLLGLPAAIFTYVGLDPVEFGPSPSPEVEGCWLTKKPQTIIFIEYILIVIFESVILALTVYKGMQQFRYGSSNLAVTLFRDGVIFYLYLIGFSLLNMVVLVIGPQPGPSLILMQRILHSILTARILLNLREAAARHRAKNSPSRSTPKTLIFDLNQLCEPIPDLSANTGGCVGGTDRWTNTHCMV